MILAAGLGTRMRPLSALRPKPVLPVRGIPLLAWPLAWLARQGVREVIVNLHHLPDATRAAAERWVPPGLAVHFSEEPTLLGTGGGIRRAASFLRESDPSLVLAGDALFDFALAPLAARHRARRDAVTLILREDARAERLDARACTWVPVGTPAEYLSANLAPTAVGYLDADAVARGLGVRLEPDLVIGAGAQLGAGVRLQRAVVWDGERVPAGLHASGGVFAGGAFHRIEEAP